MSGVVHTGVLPHTTVLPRRAADLTVVEVAGEPMFTVAFHTQLAVNSRTINKIKSVAYSFQGSHTGHLDFCN